MKNKLRIGIDSNIIIKSIFLLHFKFLKALIKNNASIILENEHLENDIINKLNLKESINFVSPKSLKGNIDVIIQYRGSLYEDIPKLQWLASGWQQSPIEFGNRVTYYLLLPNFFVFARLVFLLNKNTRKILFLGSR